MPALLLPDTLPACSSASGSLPTSLRSPLSVVDLSSPIVSARPVAVCCPAAVVIPSCWCEGVSRMFRPSPKLNTLV